MIKLSADSKYFPKIIIKIAFSLFVLLTAMSSAIMEFYFHIKHDYYRLYFTRRNNSDFVKRKYIFITKTITAGSIDACIAHNCKIL